MAAGRDFRAFVSCKTHAATDVLLAHIARVQGKLAEYRGAYPDIFARHFDARLLDVPLIRLDPRESLSPSIRALHKKDNL